MRLVAERLVGIAASSSVSFITHEACRGATRRHRRLEFRIFHHARGLSRSDASVDAGGVGGGDGQRGESRPPTLREAAMASAARAGRGRRSRRLPRCGRRRWPAPVAETSCLCLLSLPRRGRATAAPPARPAADSSDGCFVARRLLGSRDIVCVRLAAPSRRRLRVDRGGTMKGA